MHASNARALLAEVGQSGFVLHQNKCLLKIGISAIFDESQDRHPDLWRQRIWNRWSFAESSPRCLAPLTNSAAGMGDRKNYAPSHAVTH